jgi:predicted acyltransferase (DUF342 family)
VAASYPSGIKAFPNYANGDQVTPTTINDPNLEITALETGLLDGLAHDLLPDASGNQRNLGADGIRWYDLFLSHDVIVGGDLHVQGGISPVTGSVTIYGNLTAQGTVAVGTDLYVAGNTHGVGVANFDGAVGVGGTLTVTGNTIVSGTLTAASGPLIVASDVFVAGNLHIVGLANIDGAVAVGGTLTVLDTITAVGITATGIDISGAHAAAYAMTVVNTSPTGHGLHVQAGTTATENLLRLDNAAGAPLVVITATGYVQAQKLLIGGPSQLGNTVSLNRDLVSDRPFTFVGNAPTTIHTLAPRYGFDVGTMLLVSGTLANNGSVQFFDVVLAIGNATASLITGMSKGAAASRVYTVSGNNIQLTMGDIGPYHVGALPLTVESLSPAAVLLPTLPGA